MKDTIIYVGGGKGGVGKSMVSIVLVQYLLDKYGKSKTVHLIETDESNPDVGRIYKEKIPVSNALLDENEKGWILTANIIEQSRDTLFVINSAARSNMGIRKHGHNFVTIFESGKVPYNLLTLWPMNRQRDSVTLLEEYLERVSFGSVYPIRNQYFGESSDFTLYTKLYKDSKYLKNRVTKVLDFPALADLIADEFYTGGKTLPETVDKLGAFMAQSFLSWQHQAYQVFEDILEFNEE
ncbi:MAG: hypothetical protein LBC93_04825 [Synergistaceae bacterium]|jgi:hypothetical protein|nr:hypothetical protein [Synergistaceae bacterium]